MCRQDCKRYHDLWKPQQLGPWVGDAWVTFHGYCLRFCTPQLHWRHVREDMRSLESISVVQQWSWVFWSRKCFYTT